MITWTTPTMPILVKGGNILSSNVRIIFTFAQKCHVLTLEPDSTESTTDGVRCYVNWTQLQSGGFNAGKTDVQVNVIDSNGYRAASKFKSMNLGSNFLQEVITYE